jgi:ElaB/YqjD/DUF883 family membrane-anchored ribosome-binding protein
MISRGRKNSSTRREWMRENIKGTREKLEKDLQALIRDTKELLKTTAESVTGDTAELRKRLEERLNGIERNVHQKAQAAEDAVKEGLEATDEAIRNHPYPAIGISLAVGLLLGLLIRRRR